MVSEMKNISKIILGFLIVLSLGSVFPGCSKVKDIKITSCGLESYSLKGLRSVDAVLAIGIDNPAFAFTVTQIDGLVKYNGEDFATYTADTVAVAKKCSKVYDLPCSATLSDGVSLGKILSIAKNGGLEGFTTDITAKVKLKSGAGTTLKFKDLDLKEMMDE